MRLNGKNIYSLFLLIIGSFFFFSSCDVELTDSKLNRPDISLTKSGISLSIQRENSDFQYINIYRAEKQSLEEKLDFIKIGMIFPGAFDSKNDSFLFEDTFVIKGKEYVYYVRNYDSENGYFPTNATKPIQAVNGLDESEVSQLKYPSTMFRYNKTTKSLVALTDIEALPHPSLSEYVPAIVISKLKEDIDGNEIVEKTQSFKLPQTVIPENTEIPIVSLLPQDFFNSKLRFEGIIGQKEETIILDPEDLTSEEKVCRVFWTDITPVSVFDNNDTPLVSITIETHYGSDGYDYSE